MMDGRVKTLHPRCTAASSPGAICPTTWRARAARHRADRPRRRQPLSVCQAAAKPRPRLRRPDRGDRHRRPEPGARGGQELPRRAGASSIRPTTAACSRRWRGRRAAARIPVRARAEGVRAHRRPTTRRLRRRSRRCRCRRRRLRARTRSTSAVPLPESWSPRAAQASAICATARTRISRRRWYADGADRLRRAPILQGKELSFTNLLDLDAAARIVLEFDEPAAVVIKHTNPCGAATGASRGRRLRARPRRRSALGVRRHRRPQPADRCRRRREAIVSTFIEAVIAPDVDDEAQRGAGDEGEHARRHRRLRGAGVGERRSSCAIDSRRRAGAGARSRGRGAQRRGAPTATARRHQAAPTADEWTALRFAWRVCAHVKSNTVIFTGRIGRWRLARVR